MKRLKEALREFVGRFPSGVNEVRVARHAETLPDDVFSEGFAHNALFELVTEGKLTWDLPARMGEHDELTAPLVYRVVGP